MQTNGIGNNHNDMHHVTNCIHNHKHRLDSQMPSVAGGGAEKTSVQPTKAATQQEKTMSLADWLKNTISDARGLLGRIWGSDIGAVQGDVASPVGTETMADIAHIETASTAVTPVRDVNNNPYFAALTEESTPKQSTWQKIKIRFQNITGFLTKRFSFAGGSASHTRQEQPKEDLRRHSRYRKDDVEIDCILTDDSYLMDSYNKKGEYSKLSTDK